MWQSGGIGAHAANNPWMKLMGIVHKERRHHDSGSVAAAASGAQGSATTGSNDRTLNHRGILSHRRDTARSFRSESPTLKLTSPIKATTKSPIIVHSPVWLGHTTHELTTRRAWLTNLCFSHDNDPLPFGTKTYCLAWQHRTSENDGASSW
ncbi:potassium voltage-gated channel protein Shaker isoform X1 [Vespula maculifrons]|uniref:Uncharacterized protein n=3 Tax=Vespula TaxID=7451 RepID=A0A834JBY5_VESGE|nr:hypothetical protein HZH66_012450 [Vespula vulgaris]KAF7385373.1 hypothetical protein HZH68_013803 [Vespula germanica]